MVSNKKISLSLFVDNILLSDGVLYAQPKFVSAVCFWAFGSKSNKFVYAV